MTEQEGSMAEAKRPRWVWPTVATLTIAVLGGLQAQAFTTAHSASEALGSARLVADFAHSNSDDITLLADRFSDLRERLAATELNIKRTREILNDTGSSRRQVCIEVPDKDGENVVVCGQSITHSPD